MKMNNAKEKIKITALQLFMERGYYVGVNEIIERSGSSKGAFYHHFRSKDQLFIETIDRYFFSDLEQLDFLDDPHISFREQVIRLVKKRYEPFKAVNKFLPDKTMVNYLHILSEYPKHKDLNDTTIILFDNFVNILEKILEQALKDGIIKKKINTKTLFRKKSFQVDGSIADAMIIYNNINKAENGCVSAVNQLLDLLE